jgi:hypothetical protein
MEAEARGPRFSGAWGSNNDGTKPSEECKAALFQALYEWFKEMPFTNLNRNYLALGANVGKEAFVGRMRRLFEDAISGEEWDEEKRKAGYSKWMEDKLVDALYNLQPVLDRQGCHIGHPKAFWRAYWAGGQAALSIMPYMNWAGYYKQRNYCSKFTLLH